MNRTESILISSGLAIGVIFGFGGSVVPTAILQNSFYTISSLGLIMAMTLGGIKFLRARQDLTATGFFLFAIGEAVMSGGTALGQIDGQASFAAGMALYVPAFLLICLPQVFPLWVRITGIAASVPFAIAAGIIYSGGQVLSSSPLVGAAYGLMSLTIIGWILSLWGSKELVPAV